MERRVLLAISLSFAVLFLYQALLVPPAPVDPPPPSPAPESVPAAPVAGSAVSGPVPVAPTPVVATETVHGDTEERVITVESSVVRATFTNRGGRVTSWVLKPYRNADGTPLDLVANVSMSDREIPFSIRVDDANATAQLNQALYRVQGVDGSTIVVDTEPVTLTFDVELADGLRAEKRFTFERGSYIVTVGMSVERAGQPLNPVIAWGPGLGDEIARTPPGSFLSPVYTYPAQAIYSRDGEVVRHANTSLGPRHVQEGQFEYAGVDDHYFIAAVVTPGPMRLEYTPLSLSGPDDPNTLGRYVSWAVGFPVPPRDVRFFAGPKQFDVLRAVSPDFTKVIYFGIFAWLAAPLLGALQWVNGFVHNYGWSIIILTVLINLAMWPLRHKSLVSMRKMQELQPQLKVIQERYAQYKLTDPERQKMNQEVMALYKAKGVNPASGCVPMLLTLPFLFAFYAMLSQAIEIRGAGFGGWIHDLSNPDPLYITPVLMGLTMFWQQKITPTSADPTQQKVLMFMPIMFTAMMLYAPSGLVLYWFVSNLWAIGQQYLTNYLIGPPKVHNVRPPAERRVKT
jgi:YidC/Oxa1 family membrane protein insertase